MRKYDSSLDLSSRNSLSVLISRVKPESIVLEFGPAFGRMTKYLKEQLGCKVYAVELNREAGEMASKYTEKIVIDDIESYSWQREFHNIKFDHIIFADVIEHLYNPGKVLKMVKPFLKDEGSVLISIPNIAHNAIIMGLLKNEFNYSEEGLLDDTHIRFFTKKTFEDLLKKLEYHIVYESAIYVSPEDTELGYRYTDFPGEIASFLKKLEWGECYQLIYEVAKSQVNYTIKDYSAKYKNSCQLFWDEGEGFNERNSKRIYLQAEGKKRVCFSFKDEHKDIGCIRLDPLDNYTIVKISPVKSDAKIILKHSNAEMVKNNTFYFLTKDPQIYFDVIGNISFIEFEIEFTATGVIDTFRGIIQNKDAELKEKSIECEIYKVRLRRYMNAK